MRIRSVCLCFILLSVATVGAQENTTPSDEALSQINSGSLVPDYPTPYEPSSVESIESDLRRVHDYLAATTPYAVVDRESGERIEDLSRIDENATLARGAYRILSYEWGVTYSGMLLAHEVTQDPRYRSYTVDRLRFLRDVAPAFEPLLTGERSDYRIAMRSLLSPRSLDDAGSMAAAFLKAQRAELIEDVDPIIERYLDYISEDQKRLSDGTLARDRPLHDAVWLDDLYMSVPALAQMGAATGESRYFDDAVRQVRQFADRMFVPEQGLYMHAWIEGMDPHPVFFWGRANGWALMAKTELLSVLPEDHPGHAEVLDLYQRHIAGLARVQGTDGRWHQLLDRPDTYRETSATAIFVYSIARGINRGWLDPLANGPMASVGWNAVTTQINERGQVEGTCIGTGMGFDPMFYAYRPTSVFAAHGYGPVLLAGAEMIILRQGEGSEALISDGALQFAPSPAFR